MLYFPLQLIFNDETGLFLRRITETASKIKRVIEQKQKQKQKEKTVRDATVTTDLCHLT